jgi:hypothetical protein
MRSAKLRAALFGAIFGFSVSLIGYFVIVGFARAVDDLPIVSPPQMLEFLRGRPLYLFPASPGIHSAFAGWVLGLFISAFAGEKLAICLGLEFGTRHEPSEGDGVGYLVCLIGSFASGAVAYFVGPVLVLAAYSLLGAILGRASLEY